MTTRHVVLLTYGEPPTPSFPAQLRYSWRILLGLTRRVAPIPRWVLPMVALSRARFRWWLWTRERYASPLEPLSREQARGLESALAARAPGTRWRVHLAYEFRDPLLPRVLDRLPAEEPVDVLPMYVADSDFTHAISRDTVRRWAAGRRRARPAPVRVLDPLPEEEFARVSAGHVEREIASRGIGGPGWTLALAAHGTLLDPPRSMETGRAATEKVCAALSARLAPRFDRVVGGWLNHVYGGRWTEPPMDQALRQVADAGGRRVVYFPYGFCADNAESQLEGRIALRVRPWDQAVHLPCLNAEPAYMEALAAWVAGAAGAHEAPESASPRAGAARSLAAASG